MAVAVPNSASAAAAKAIAPIPEYRNCMTASLHECAPERAQAERITGPPRAWIPRNFHEDR
ncbi:hypothetical protein MCEL_39920 [Mycolicibacterium celeriflavum]|uniref:Uncharacterized protein n=1 Tax=Mycolicibacterium celeriflavum TaxID=1249101 RepID=A0A7I7RMC5_MYCCF|nr:hypothetical protein MCEL_39920 [Mycolicibacterium celeriflavum]